MCDFKIRGMHFYIIFPYNSLMGFRTASNKKN